MSGLIAQGWHHSLCVDESGIAWSTSLMNNQYDSQQSNNDLSFNFLPIIDISEIISVFAGRNCSFLLDTDGHPWANGSNESCKLGFADSLKRNAFEKMYNLPEIKSISCAPRSTFFLDYNGEVRVAGCSFENFQQQNCPSKIENLPQIQQISCGFDYALFLDVNGKVWSYGNDGYGLGGYPGSGKSKEWDNLTEIISISAGSNHCLLLDKNKHLWSSGCNNVGQLGTGSRENSYFPLKLPFSNTNLVDFISAGNDFSHIIDSNGILFGFGDNEYFQLGSDEQKTYLQPTIIENLPKIKVVSGSNCFSLLLDTEGNYYRCGSLLYSDVKLNIISTFTFDSDGVKTHPSNYTTKNARK